MAKVMSLMINIKDYLFVSNSLKDTYLKQKQHI